MYPPIPICLSARLEHAQVARALAARLGEIPHLEVTNPWWDSIVQEDDPERPFKLGDLASRGIRLCGQARILVLLQPMAKPGRLGRSSLLEAGAALGAGVPILYCGHDWAGRPGFLRHPLVTQPSMGWSTDYLVSFLADKLVANHFARPSSAWTSGVDLGPLHRAWTAREEAREVSRKMSEGLRDRILGDQPTEKVPSLADAVRATSKAQDSMTAEVRALLVQGGLL